MGGNIYSDWDTDETSESEVIENDTTLSSDVDNELVDPRSLPEEGE